MLNTSRARLVPLILLASAGVQAQSAEPVPAPQQVEIKGSYNERREDTATKTVVTRADILRFGDTTLLDVLKRLPAITVVDGQVRMRGLGGGYTQILLDGQKAPAGFSIESLAPDAIEKIEILRSASADMSTQAIAGTINIVTRKSVRTAQRDMKFSVGTEGGKPGPYWYWTDSGKTGTRSHTYALSAAQNHFGGPETGTEEYVDIHGRPTTVIDNVRHSRGVGNSVFGTARHNWKADNGDAFSAYSVIRRMQNKNTSDDTSSTRFGDDPPFGSLHSQARTGTSIISSNLTWLHQLGEKSSLDVKVGASYTARDLAQQFAGRTVGDVLSLARTIDGHTNDAGLTSAGKASSTLVDEHTIVAGWDVATQWRDDRRRQDELRLLPDQTYAPALTEQTARIEVRRMALFVQDEWNATPRLSAYLGLRWETVATQSAGSDVNPITNRSAVFSPIAQALWKLPASDTSQMRFALARTYKAPDVGSLNARPVQSTNNQRHTPDFQGNPDLRPELSWGLDVGFEHFAADGAMFSASAYVRRISDVTGTSVTQVDGRYVAKPDNIGNAVSRGIELEAKFNLQKLMKRAPGVELRVNLNRNWSQVDAIPGPDNRLESQTPLSANLGFDYVLPAAGHSVGGNVSFQTGGWLSRSQDEFAYTSVVRNLELYGLWKMDRQLQLRLVLANLLHQPNVTASRFTTVDGGSLHRQVGSNPATARLTVEYKFR
jgi:outer membrane receptor for ferrienterochelin and colicins